MPFTPVMNIDIGDHDSADPLNPLAKYPHFHPSAEQHDPHIPLGFKILGTGCLVAFIVFLLVVAIWAIDSQIKYLRRQQDGEKGEVCSGNVLNNSISQFQQIVQKIESVSAEEKTPSVTIICFPERAVTTDHAFPQQPALPLNPRDKKPMPKGILKTSPTFVPRAPVCCCKPSS
jgi:hypothetical protein